jgi:hypothetical protein
MRRQAPFFFQSDASQKPHKAQKTFSIRKAEIVKLLALILFIPLADRSAHIARAMIGIPAAR